MSGEQQPLPGEGSGGEGEGGAQAPQQAFKHLSTLLDKVCSDPANFSSAIGSEIDAAAQLLVDHTPRDARGGSLVWKAALSIWNCVVVPVTNATAQATAGENSRRNAVEQSVAELRVRVW